mmetsp:Transcript_9249/g.28144  ORF Transcript_9249/g.28144 Transcript_9249/m.28144 type:complete len:232 (-) Transcript_9249:1589-2284(-)
MVSIGVSCTALISIRPRPFLASVVIPLKSRYVHLSAGAATAWAEPVSHTGFPASTEPSAIWMCPGVDSLIVMLVVNIPCIKPKSYKSWMDSAGAPPWRSRRPPPPSLPSSPPPPSPSLRSSPSSPPLRAPPPPTRFPNAASSTEAWWLTARIAGSGKSPNGMPAGRTADARLSSRLARHSNPVSPCSTLTPAHALRPTPASPVRHTRSGSSIPPRSVRFPGGGTLSRPSPP